MMSDEVKDVSTPTSPLYIGDGIIVDYLSSHRHYASELGPLFFTEWPAAYIAMNLSSAEAVTDRLIAHNMNAKQIPITLIAFMVTPQTSGGHTLVGSVTIDIDDLPVGNPYYSKRPWLASVYTCEAYRRRGIAHIMIACAIQRATQLGYESLWLWTVRSVQLYAQMQWNIIENLSVEWKQKPITIMQRVLLSSQQPQAQAGDDDDTNIQDILRRFQSYRCHDQRKQP